MPLLVNDTILLISPQPWDHIHISKHHYAIELARQGNTVYFLEPPDSAAAAAISVKPVAGNTGIFVVRYRPKFPLVIRFHFRWLYDRLMRGQIRSIQKAIGRPIGVVWCFDFNLYSDLKAFGPRLAIFHPVDRLSTPYHVGVARSADVVFSVSEDILARFRDLKVPTWFINHGVSEAFAETARSSMGQSWTQGAITRIGYSGNLRRTPLDRDVILRMVIENPSLEFHFWGPWQSVSHEEESAREINAFIAGLQRQPNARVHGPVPAEELARHLQLMDCLILAYRSHQREYDSSNSHKLLEYLATGRVIVSSRLTTYIEHAELVRMPEDGDDSSLPALLRDTIAHLENFNAVELQNRRRRLALDNTYQKQLDRIRAKLSA